MAFWKKKFWKVEVPETVKEVMVEVVRVALPRLSRRVVLLSSKAPPPKILRLPVMVDVPALKVPVPVAAAKFK